MTTQLTKIETLSFIPFQDIKDTPLMWQLLRNQVKFEAVRKVSRDPFNLDQSSEKDKIFEDITDDLYSFCNANCTGVWTYNYVSYVDESDKSFLHAAQMPYYSVMASPVTLLMRGSMEVYFEYREDRDKFMRDHVLIRKLAQE